MQAGAVWRALFMVMPWGRWDQAVRSPQLLQAVHCALLLQAMQNSRCSECSFPWETLCHSSFWLCSEHLGWLCTMVDLWIVLPITTNYLFLGAEMRVTWKNSNHIKKVQDFFRLSSTRTECHCFTWTASRGGCPALRWQWLSSTYHLNARCVKKQASRKLFPVTGDHSASSHCKHDLTGLSAHPVYQAGNAVYSKHTLICVGHILPFALPCSSR